MPDPPLLVGVGKEGPTDRQTDKAFSRPTPWVWQRVLKRGSWHQYKSHQFFGLRSSQPEPMPPGYGLHEPRPPGYGLHEPMPPGYGFAAKQWIVRIHLSLRAKYFVIRKNRQPAKIFFCVSIATET